jgi:hypothetical protein
MVGEQSHRSRENLVKNRHAGPVVTSDLSGRGIIGIINDAIKDDQIEPPGWCVQNPPYTGSETKKGFACNNEPASQHCCSQAHQLNQALHNLGKPNSSKRGCIILTSLTKSSLIIVPLLGADRVTERRLLSRRGLLVLIAVLGLAVSLAGRVFAGEIYSSASIHSGSTCAKVQHRDSDAARWVPPTAVYVLLWASQRSFRIGPADQIQFHLHYDCLYNRPPPTVA